MSVKPFPRVSCCAKVRFCREKAPNVFELAIERRLEEPAVKIPKPQPGQFFMLKAPVSAVFLPRPVSVFMCDSQTVRFLIQKKGAGTAELCSLRKGDMIRLAGPTGSGFTLPCKVFSDKLTRAETLRASFEASKRSALSCVSGLLASASALRPLLRQEEVGFLRAALIGGGIGIAPVTYLASALPEKSFDFFACFRSLPYGIEGAASRAERLFITTEDGSAGVKGMLPDVFNPSDYDLVYACGPAPMLKYVKATCEGLPVEVFLSLESRMACGAGACLGCAIETKSGRKRCCVDGPVFPAEELLL